MDNLHQGMENKNKEITKIKAKVDDLNKQIVKKDQEINQVMVALEINKSKT